MKNTFRKTLLATALAGALSPVAMAADLKELYGKSLTQDPAYRSARFELQAAQEATPQARAALLPNVGAQATGNVNQTDPPSGGSFSSRTSSLGVSLTQPLFRRQNSIALDQAKLSVEQAEAKFADAKQDLILRLSQAYFDVLLAQDNVALSAAQKTAIAEQLAQAKRSFEVGTATIVDQNDAQARYDLAVAKEIADQNDLEVKKRALQQIVADTGENLAALREDVAFTAPQPANLADWVKSAEDSNKSVQQARLGLDVAKLDIDRNRAGHLPTLDLTASAGSNYSNRATINATGGTASGTSNSASAGLVFTVPLYQGGGVDSRVRQAIATRDRAESELERARRSVAQAARQSYLGVTSGIAQVGALEAALKSSQTSLDSTTLGRDVGVRTSVDVLNAQQQLFQARRDLFAARYNVILSQLRLKSAVGQLDEKDIDEVNARLKK